MKHISKQKENSDRMKKAILWLKRTFSWMAVIIIFLCSWKALRYCLNDDRSSYTRITMHEFYDQENIDTVFIGASHCYRAFVPSIFNERAGILEAQANK